ncbi:MAG TPA: PspC domain-containing protein [Sphingomonas sp.]|nr:PspC domain-containing protein [Sphingomonas sp.]
MKTETAHPAAQDNLLGICHALGETFGFNPIFLRLVLMVGVIVSPQITVIAYLVAGIAVLVATLVTRRTTGRARA